MMTILLVYGLVTLAVIGLALVLIGVMILGVDSLFPMSFISSGILFIYLAYRWSPFIINVTIQK